jgi:hypothetical protein
VHTSKQQKVQFPNGADSIDEGKKDKRPAVKIGSKIPTLCGEEIPLQASNFKVTFGVSALANQKPRRETVAPGCVLKVKKRPFRASPHSNSNNSEVTLEGLVGLLETWPHLRRLVHTLNISSCTPLLPVFRFRFPLLCPPSPSAPPFLWARFAETMTRSILPNCSV